MEQGHLLVYVILTTCAVSCQKTINMYRSPNYKGLLYSVEVESGCLNVPSFANDRISSIQTEVCVFAFEHPNCDGMSIKLIPDEPVGKNLQEVGNIGIRSFRACSENLSGNEVNVKVYGSKKLSNFQAEYTNVCGCKTFPPDLNGKLGSLDNHGHCLYLYTDKDCQGEKLLLRAGRSRVSEDIKILHHEPPNADGIYRSIRGVKSFQPCEIPPSCYELQIKAYKIEVISDNATETGEVELAPKDTFYNTGAGTITKQCTKTRNITQIVEITNVISFSASAFNFKEHRVDAQSEIFIQFSIPVGSWFSSQLTRQSFENALSTYFRLAYSSPQEYFRQKTKTMIFTEQQNVTVSQQITIPGFTECEIRYAMKIIEDFPLSYYRYYEVTGKLGGKVLGQSALREQVAKLGVKIKSSPDNNTILVRAKDAIKITTGLEGYISKHCSPISVVTTELSTSDSFTEHISFGLTTHRNKEDLSTKLSNKDYSTERYNKDVSTERYDKDLSTERYNKDLSTERYNKDLSTERYNNDLSTERYNKDLSTEHYDKDRSTEHYDKDRSTEHISKHRSTERINEDRSTERIDKDRFTERINKDRSTERVNKDSSTELINKDRSTERINKDSSTERINNDRSTERITNDFFAHGNRKDLSTGSDIKDRSTERINKASSTERINNDRSTERINKDSSTERITNDSSTERINNDRFTERINSDRSAEGNSKDLFTERNDTDGSTDANNTDLSTEADNTDLSIERNYTDLSTERDNTDLSTETNNKDLSTERNDTDLSTERNNTELFAEHTNAGNSFAHITYDIWNFVLRHLTLFIICISVFMSLLIFTLFIIISRYICRTRSRSRNMILYKKCPLSASNQFKKQYPGK